MEGLSNAGIPHPSLKGADFNNPILRSPTIFPLDNFMRSFLMKFSSEIRLDFKIQLSDGSYPGDLFARCKIQTQ